VEVYGGRFQCLDPAAVKYRGRNSAAVRRNKRRIMTGGSYPPSVSLQYAHMKAVHLRLFLYGILMCKIHWWRGTWFAHPVRWQRNACLVLWMRRGDRTTESLTVNTSLRRRQFRTELTETYPSTLDPERTAVFNVYYAARSLWILFADRSWCVVVVCFITGCL
jgi:hypothetical protein